LQEARLEPPVKISQESLYKELVTEAELQKLHPSLAGNSDSLGVKQIKEFHLSSWA